jgi:hypothetical protein
MNTTDNIKQTLKEIEETVSVIEDPELKKIAFEKLVDMKWGLAKPVEDKQTESASTVGEKVIAAPVVEKGIKVLCQQLGVSVESFREKVDFGEGYPRLFYPPDEKTRLRLQFKGLMLLSIIMKKVYGKNTVNPTDLLKMNGFPTERLDNLSTIKGFNRLFSKEGSELKLTWPGENNALELLKEYLSSS